MWLILNGSFYRIYKKFEKSILPKNNLRKLRHRSAELEFENLLYGSRNAAGADAEHLEQFFWLATPRNSSDREALDDDVTLTWNGRRHRLSDATCNDSNFKM